MSMPYGHFQWVDRQLELDLGQEPNVGLRQKGRKTFVLLRSFLYCVLDCGPTKVLCYVIPGEDAPTEAGGRRRAARSSSSSATPVICVMRRKGWFDIPRRK
jgi:hypothetical protein